MSHRNRNENRDHKARKDPKKLARSTKIHTTYKGWMEQAEQLEQDITDAITEWEDEGGNT